MGTNNEMAKLAAVLLTAMANELNEWNKKERKKVRAYKKKGQHEKAKATESARIIHLAEKIGEYNNSDELAKVVNYVREANKAAELHGISLLNMVRNDQRQTLNKAVTDLSKELATQ